MNSFSVTKVQLPVGDDVEGDIDRSRMVVAEKRPKSILLAVTMVSHICLVWETLQQR